MPASGDYRDTATWLESANRSPDDWETAAEEPMTHEQATRLKALSWRLGIPFDKHLDSHTAERRIAELSRRP